MHPSFQSIVALKTIYICGQVSNLSFTIKIKTFQECTFKNKEVEIMDGWCLSGYDGRCQWSLS
jgi:hypothetical protein